MADQWLCLVDGKQVGPIPFTRLQQLAQAKRIKAQDFVRPATQDEWMYAGDVPNLISAAAVSPGSITHDAPESPISQPVISQAKRRDSGVIPVGKRAVAGESVAVEASEAPEASSAAPAFLLETDSSGSGRRSTTKKKVASHSKVSAKPGLVTKRKQSQRLPQLALIGGGIVLGTGVLLGLLVMSGVISFNTASQPLAEKNGERQRNSSKVADVDDEATANDDSESSNNARRTAGKQQALSSDAILKSVAKWNDASKTKQISFGSAKVGVTGVWLSATEGGDPYVAAADGGPKFLVVKVQIDNAPGAASLSYLGWSNDAALIDEAGKVVRPSTANSAARSGKQRIEPGTSLVDTLMFPLADADFEKIRLALPHATLGTKDDKSFGLELPRQVVGRGVDANLVAGSSPVVGPPIEANAVLANTAALAAPSSEPAIIKTSDPPVAAKAAPTAPKEKDELGLDKLDEKARMLDKMEKGKQN